MQNAGVVESQIGIRLAGRNINSLCFADDAILVSGSEEELKSLLESETEDWKSWPEIQHSKTKIAAFGPITSWQIEGGTVEAVTDFPFLGSRITVNHDCSHEIKRHLFLGRKPVTNLDSVLKSREFTLLTKVCLVKTMVFPVVIHVRESWIIKKAECCRIDAPQSWCWRRFLKVPWEDSWESLGLQGDQTSQLKGNQPSIFIGRNDAEAETPILWPPDAKVWLIGKDW